MERWLASKCAKVEELEEKHYSLNTHERVKEAAGIMKNLKLEILVNEKGGTIWNTKEKIIQWE